MAHTRLPRLFAVMVGLPAAAWLVALGVTYLVADFVCSAAAAGYPTPSPTVVRTVLLVVSLVLVVPAAWPAVQGYRRLDRGGDMTSDSTEGVARFLALVGVWLGAVFAFGVVLLAVNPLLFGRCAA